MSSIDVDAFMAMDLKMRGHDRNVSQSTVEDELNQMMDLYKSMTPAERKDVNNMQGQKNSTMGSDTDHGRVNLVKHDDPNNPGKTVTYMEFDLPPYPGNVVGLYAKKGVDVKSSIVLQENR